VSVLQLNLKCQVRGGPRPRSSSLMSLQLNEDQGDGLVPPYTRRRVSLPVCLCNVRHSTYWLQLLLTLLLLLSLSGCCCTHASVSGWL
jgi:hypothetical protein